MILKARIVQRALGSDPRSWQYGPSLSMISTKTTAGLIERGHNKAEGKIEFYFRGIKFCFRKNSRK